MLARRINAGFWLTDRLATVTLLFNHPSLHSGPATGPPWNSSRGGISATNGENQAVPSIQPRNRAIAFCGGGLPAIVVHRPHLCTLACRRPCEFRRTEAASQLPHRHRPVALEGRLQHGGVPRQSQRQGGLQAEPARRRPVLRLPVADPRPVRPAAQPDRAGIELDRAQADGGHSPRRGPAVPSRLDRGPDAARLDRRGCQRRSGLRSPRQIPARLSRRADPGARGPRPAARCHRSL